MGRDSSGWPSRNHRMFGRRNSTETVENTRVVLAIAGERNVQRTSVPFVRVFKEDRPEMLSIAERLWQLQPYRRYRSNVFFLAVRKNISEYALDKYIVGIH